jgi:hypothetical protein
MTRTNIEWVAQAEKGRFYFNAVKRGKEWNSAFREGSEQGVSLHRSLSSQRTDLL